MKSLSLDIEYLKKKHAKGFLQDLLISHVGRKYILDNRQST